MKKTAQKIAFLIFSVVVVSVLTILVANAEKQLLLRKVGLDDANMKYDKDTYHVAFYDSDGGKQGGQLLWQADVPAGYTLILEGTPSDESKTFVYEGSIPTRKGYVFDRWISDTGSYTISSDTNFVARYKSDDIYMISVRYKYSNGNIAHDTFVQTAQYDDTYTINSPTIDGYTADLEVVEGTITDEHLEELGKLDNVEINCIEDTKGNKVYQIYIIVTYSPSKSSYTVNHYKQTTDGTHYDLAETIIYDENVWIGDKVATSSNDYEGFSVNLDKSIFEGIVQADGKTSLDVYYDREIYNVYYYPKGGTYYEPQQILYGAEITNIPSPTRDGYIFAGWTWKKSLDGDAIDRPDIMSNYNLYAVANWDSIEVNYGIAYFVENADDNEYTNIGEITSTAISDSIIDINNIEDVIVRTVSELLWVKKSIIIIPGIEMQL